MLAVFSFFTKLPSVEDEDVSEDQIRELLAEADEEDIDEPQKELLANVPFQKNLTKIMARQTDWVRQAGVKLYAPYGKGVGYRRKMK